MRSSRPLWPVCGPVLAERNLADQADDSLRPSDLGLHAGAGEGNRTLMTSLEGCPHIVVMGSDLGIRVAAGSRS